MDLEEFVAWFGKGPPPPPTTPEVVERMQARQDASAWLPDQATHFGAIRKEVWSARV